MRSLLSARQIENKDVMIRESVEGYSMSVRMEREGFNGYQVEVFVVIGQQGGSGNWITAVENGDTFQIKFTEMK